MLIYEGESLLDDQPIIVVAVPDYSKKVGQMLLSWIILRDVDPRAAAYDGRDSSICGSCPYRAKEPLEKVYDPEKSMSIRLTQMTQRACYVRPHREPYMIWEKYHDDEYPVPGDDWKREVNPYRIPVRVGSYGDPAVVPTYVWRRLVATADRWTGYSHLYREPWVDPELKKYCMASTDTLEQRQWAHSNGWRTFHVSRNAHEDDLICPASAAGGKKTTCDRCRLCQGTAINCKSIAIQPHGPGAEFVV